MILKNRLIPFGRFVAMAIYPFIFIKKYAYDLPKDIFDEILNHEKIHFAQQKELYIIIFFIMYLYWWIRFGYKNIPFEKEAYGNQKNLEYLKTRKKYAYKKYMNKT